jgi:hypothetical protein
LRSVNAAEKEKLEQGYPKMASTDGWPNNRESDEVRQAAWALHTSLQGDSDQAIYKAGQHALAGDDAFKTWVDQHPWRARTASSATRALAGVYLRLWSAKEALLFSTSQSKRARLDNPSQADARVHCAVTHSTAPAQVPATVSTSSAPAQVPATVFPSTAPATAPTFSSLGIQPPLTHEEDMMDLRSAAKESMAEFQKAAQRNEELQLRLDAAIHATQNPSAATVVHGGARPSGAGGVASGSGVGSQECTQEEIQALQTLDTSVPVDPMGKAINKPIGQCDSELLQQRSALQGTCYVPAPNSAALYVPSVPVPSVPSVPSVPVPSVEAINAQKNMLAAAAAYEAVLASEAPLLPHPDQTSRLTAANTRANSVPQSAQMQRPARNQVAFALPSSRAAVTQSQPQPSPTQARLPVMPSTDGSGRYPDTVHFFTYHGALHTVEQCRKS